MIENKPVTRQDIRTGLKNSSGQWFLLDDIKRSLSIDEAAYGKLYKAMYDIALKGYVSQEADVQGNIGRLLQK